MTDILNIVDRLELFTNGLGKAILRELRTELARVQVQESDIERLYIR